MGNERWRIETAVMSRDKILNAVDEYLAEHGYSPTRQDLATMTGLAERTVRQYVKELIAEGLLEEPGGARSRTLRPPA